MIFCFAFYQVCFSRILRIFPSIFFFIFFFFVEKKKKTSFLPPLSHTPFFSFLFFFLVLFSPFFFFLLDQEQMPNWNSEAASSGRLIQEQHIPKIIRPGLHTEIRHGQLHRAARCHLSGGGASPKTECTRCIHAAPHGLAHTGRARI